jgi:LacI family transcriptional regulator
MATLRDIAVRAQVSISTASRALSGHHHVQDQTRERIQAIARELGYVPNSLARGLRRNQTRTIGVLIPDLRNSSFSSESAVLLQRQFQELGYGTVLYVTRYDRETELRCIDRLRFQQVDGVLRVPTTATSVDVLSDGARSIPVLEFLRRSQSERYDGVLYDDEEGAYRVMEHLIHLGHRRIGVITGPPETSSTKRRLSGAGRALAAAGLGPKALRVAHGEYSPATGHRGFETLMAVEPPVTAVFATSAQFVLGVAMAAKEQNVLIPQRVSLAAFGDPEWGQLISPPLTTYTLPLPEMAMTAALLLTSRIEKGPPEDGRPVRIWISGDLVVRGSTAPPGGSVAGRP